MNLNISIEQFSSELGQITHPRHPFYFPFQVLLFSSLTYLSTACLTSIRPLHAATFMTIAFTISHLTAPFFAKWLEPYRQIALVPLTGQILHLTLAVLLAKTICKISRCPLTFKHITRIGVLFLVALYVMKFALLKFRQQGQLAHFNH